MMKATAVVCAVLLTTTFIIHYKKMCKRLKLPEKYIALSLELNASEFKDIKLVVYPPNPDKSKLHLSHPDKQSWSHKNQSYIVDEILNEKKNGFFLECGAADGEVFSNTLFFEVFRNWTGLLIEANNDVYQSLHGKKRNAYIYEGCLSPNYHIFETEFKHYYMLSGIGEFFEKSRKDPSGSYRKTKKKCIPLITLLDRLNITHIDYFSLDTEGSELHILKTIPFDRIRIDVLSVEYDIHKGDEEEKQMKRKRLLRFMLGTNLYVEKDVFHPTDLFFYRKELYSWFE